MATIHVFVQHDRGKPETVKQLRRTAEMSKTSSSCRKPTRFCTEKHYHKETTVWGLQLVFVQAFCSPKAVTLAEFRLLFFNVLETFEMNRTAAPSSLMLNTFRFLKETLQERPPVFQEQQKPGLYRR